MIHECYANSAHRSHIAIWFPPKKYEIAGMSFTTGGFWRNVCGASIKGPIYADRPTRPLCKRCQALRAIQERNLAAREGTR